MTRAAAVLLLALLTVSCVVFADEEVRYGTGRMALPGELVNVVRSKSGEPIISRTRLLAVDDPSAVAKGGQIGVRFETPGAAYDRDLNMSWAKPVGDPAYYAGAEFVIPGKLSWPRFTVEDLGSVPPEGTATIGGIGRVYTVFEERRFPGVYGLGIHFWYWQTDRTLWTFDSDPAYPLVLKSALDGWVVLCGRGRITLAASPGQVFIAGSDDTVAAWLPLLKRDDQLLREGAAQALGYLAGTTDDTEKAVPALMDALKDSAWEVRRNAAEALGRIGDPRATEALARLTDPANEKDDWVRDVAEESVGLIGVKTAAPKLPNEPALTTLTEGLKHKWPLVRKTAAELLAKGGAPAVEPLIASLKDEDARVRAAAATSLGAIGDARAIDPLKQSLSEETDEAAKQAMADALKLL
jgi:hypothetical protein